MFLKLILIAGVIKASLFTKIKPLYLTIFYTILLVYVAFNQGSEYIHLIGFGFFNFICMYIVLHFLKKFEGSTDWWALIFGFFIFEIIMWDFLELYGYF